MESTLYPLAHTLRNTVFSLKGSEFTRNKSPRALFAHGDATSSHLNFKSKSLRSRAEPIISDSYYSSLQQM